jgi:hypothetical protein
VPNVTFTKFGETKSVPATLYNMTEDETPDELLWVERQEDWYALQSTQLKDKKVAVVRREDWLTAESE